MRTLCFAMVSTVGTPLVSVHQLGTDNLGSIAPDLDAFPGPQETEAYLEKEGIEGAQANHFRYVALVHAIDLSQMGSETVRDGIPYEALYEVLERLDEIQGDESFLPLLQNFFHEGVKAGVAHERGKETFLVSRLSSLDRESTWEELGAVTNHTARGAARMLGLPAMREHAGNIWTCVGEDKYQYRLRLLRKCQPLT